MSDHFPGEIVQDILLRLPVKSLVRCCSVCKSWRSLIESSAFIHAHLHRTIQSNDQNDTHLLLSNRYPYNHEKDLEVFSLRNWDKPAAGGESTKLINPLFDINPSDFPATIPPKRFHVVGTCDGLICLVIYASDDTIIWNPCVRKFVCLPSLWDPSPEELLFGVPSLTYFFGYDSRADDYKVGRVLRWGAEPPRFDIWSLATGSWKSLSPDVVPVDYFSILASGGRISVNGLLIWGKMRPSNEQLLCFDMVSESFGKIMLPDALVGLNFTPILRCRESLALVEIEYRPAQFGGTSLHIWVMKEFGVPESWTKLLSINFTECVSTPYGFIHTGQVVLEIPDDKRIDRKLVSLDPHTREVKDLEIGLGYCEDSYTESLVLLGQRNAISY